MKSILQLFPQLMFRLAGIYFDMTLLSSISEFIAKCLLRKLDIDTL